MITRIEIDGFKSFRGFALDFEPLMAIVGPNSAGKSNLFDALQLLRRQSLMDQYDAMKQGRGRVRDQFARDRTGSAKVIRIAAELLLSRADAMNRCRWESTVSRQEQPSGTEVLRIESDFLPIEETADAWMHRHPEYRPLVRYGQDRNTDDLINAVNDELMGWGFLHVDASRLRAPSERAAAPTLASDGSNLPTVLVGLSPEIAAQVRADLADLVPGVRTFKVVPIDDEFQIEVEFTDGLRLPARVLSDGTLRILAFLALMRSSPPGAVLGLEEPENGIFPGRLRALIRKLREVTTAEGHVPVQVLLNSHSPTALAALHDQPQSMVFADLVRHRDGLRSTRMRHVVAGPSPDRGATTVSLREIERILETADPGDEE